MAQRDKQWALVEVNETVTYQIPLDVADPDDHDSIMSAWLVKDQAEVEEFRTGSATTFKILQREDQTLERLVEHLEGALEALHYVLSTKNSQD